MPTTMKKKECYYRVELEKVDWNRLQSKGARGTTVSNPYTSEPGMASPVKK